MKEKEIIDIIKKYVGYTDRSMTDQCLHEVNFSLVAKEIVKKLTKDKETKPTKKFECYEMHAYSRFAGCSKQCTECQQEQLARHIEREDRLNSNK